MILWDHEEDLHSNSTYLGRRRLFRLIWKVELNISVDPERQISGEGIDVSKKPCPYVGKLELSPSIGCGSSLIWPLTRPQSSCERSSNDCGRLLRHWCEVDDGKVKGEMKSLSSFPSSPALPFTALLSLILIADWETTENESGFDPNTPTLWRHLLLLFSLIFMHNPTQFFMG